MNIVRVALDLPLPTLFDYLAPDAVESDVGRRVTVPFGKGLRTGVIVELATASEQPDAKLKQVLPSCATCRPCRPSGWRSANFAHATIRPRSAK
jgi:primosomal protein N'